MALVLFLMFSMLYLELKLFILLMLKKPEMVIPTIKEPINENKILLRIPGENVFIRGEYPIKTSKPNMIIKIRKNKETAPNKL